MKLSDLEAMSKDEVYDLFSKERINANSPRETCTRKFPIGSRAYMWTNEAMCNLKDDFNLNLKGRDMLVVTASGDPFPIFSYLGASTIVGFDSSHRASLWAELKLLAIDRLNYEGFEKFVGLNKDDEDSEGDEDDKHDETKEKKYVKWLLPKLSKYGQEFFKPLFEKHGTLRGIVQSGELFRGGECTSYFPGSNIYTDDKIKYQKARKNLRKNKQVIVPACISDVFDKVDHKFGGFYGSNIMDHFRNSAGDLDHSQSTVSGFLKSVDSHLDKDALMVLQFEWSPEVRQYATQTLQDLGYKIDFATTQGKGYGVIGLARREK